MWKILNFLAKISLLTPSGCTNLTSLPSCLAPVLKHSWSWIYFCSTPTEDSLRLTALIHQEINCPIAIWSSNSTKQEEILLKHFRQVNFEYTNVLVTTQADFEAFRALMNKEIEQKHIKRGDYVIVARISCDSSEQSSVLVQGYRLTAGPESLQPKDTTKIFNIKKSCLQQFKISNKIYKRVVLITTQRTSISKGLMWSKHPPKASYGRDFRDFWLLRFVFQYLRIRYKYLDNSDVDTGADDSNSNTGAAFDQVYQGKADMSGNSRIFVWSNYSERLVDNVHPISRDDVVILLPINMKISSTSTFFYISLAHALFILLTIFCITFLYIYLKLFSISSPCMTAHLIFVSVTTGQSFKELKIKYFRLVFASLLMFVFFITTVFTYQLYSEFAINKRVPKINSIEDFVATDLKIYARNGIRSKIKHSLKGDPVYKKIIPRIVKLNASLDDIAEEVKYLRGCYPYAILCRESTLHFYRHDVRNFCYYKLPQSLMPSLSTFMIGYKHPLLQKINEALIIIRDTGLMTKFYRSSSTKRDENMRSIKMRFMVLTLKSTRPVWFIYFGGLCVATGVFIVEIVLKKMQILYKRYLMSISGPFFPKTT
ncbi:uncharacterized protein LOC126741357 [Anthonomus grandis grandis]|uniref:uncharacterized protein LOC126741357 n=1 Tax=Anthonomus grandis grandis TaxID=2921223 RepID=UPI0021668DFD|nr:uncharacterized protein LOC126741357 [Anthonomus grandis grandis]